MTALNELKTIGSNCNYYNSVNKNSAFVSLIDPNASPSCGTCSNWSDEKCAIGVYDAVKNFVKIKSNKK